MKFYTPRCIEYDSTMLPSADIQMKEDQYGEWATRDDAEQVAKERDEFKRKAEELCLAYGRALMELNDAKRDAVEMAQALQRYLRTFRNDDDHVLWQQAQAIIERYEGGQG